MQRRGVMRAAVHTARCQSRWPGYSTGNGVPWFSWLQLLQCAPAAAGPPRRATAVGKFPAKNTCSDGGNTRGANRTSVEDVMSNHEFGGLNAHDVGSTRTQNSMLLNRTRSRNRTFDFLDSSLRIIDSPIRNNHFVLFCRFPFRQSSILNFSSD